MPDQEGWYKKVVLTFTRSVGGETETKVRSFFYFKLNDIAEAKDVDEMVERAKGYIKEAGWELQSSQTYFPE
ncbi:hypothetical protein C4561_05570 [candidate division WWE3 bacterium]|uniref:Uncharacterized protein n=1 Tax=candidate division WWE3 bacterium TaxID=2053526 RepID=A0A3A4ZAG9_UNCKA|nr:MAG: hypothetical protein C4561_05570 [candidate division WWE3 bacterium]